MLRLACNEAADSKMGPTGARFPWAHTFVLLSSEKIFICQMQARKNPIFEHQKPLFLPKVERTRLGGHDAVGVGTHSADTTSYRSTGERARLRHGGQGWRDDTQDLCAATPGRVGLRDLLAYAMPFVVARHGTVQDQSPMLPSSFEEETMKSDLKVEPSYMCSAQCTLPPGRPLPLHHAHFLCRIFIIFVRKCPKTTGMLGKVEAMLKWLMENRAPPHAPHQG